jgi:hypothetical protein
LVAIYPQTVPAEKKPALPVTGDLEGQQVR